MDSPILSSAKWIWLDEKKHPDFQKSFTTVFVSPQDEFHYCVAEFQKSFILEKEPIAARVVLSADTKYVLSVNGEHIGCGPAAAGGDYDNTDAMPYYYADSYNISLKKGENRFFALVQLTPTVQADYSCGHGGLILCCTVTFADGTTEKIVTDHSWQARLCAQRPKEDTFLPGAPSFAWEQAAFVEQPVWQLRLSQLPPMQEQFIMPVSYEIPEEYRSRVSITDNTVTIQPGSPMAFFVRFDKIYSGIVTTHVSCADKGIVILIHPQEMIAREAYTDWKRLITSGEDFDYRSIRMNSIGYYQITVSNFKTQPVTLRNLGLIFTCYPVTEEGSFSCNEELLNRIYELGKWTLRICRQSYHMDSPTHQEALGCTGDYYIESLINYFSFGDPRLTKQDIIRTADLLRMHDGKMFHTSYSLIFVQMILDYYRFTGDKALLEEVIDALHILMKRFHGYLGETGLLENLPNYMFIDWAEVDEFNLHHPPKVLGQSSMNAFYYKALVDFAEICTLLAQDDWAKEYLSRAENIKKAFRSLLWDEEKQMYFDGRIDDQPEIQWRPANVARRYFSQHTNALAVLYHLCDDEKAPLLLDKIVHDASLVQAQPYFMHFIMDAIWEGGCFAQYGLEQIRRWKLLLDQCDRGMKECWYGFDGDFSHAWGATPTYQLPARLMGFEMVKPNFAAIRLHPQLFGLTHADISMPTPYGKIHVVMKQGEAPICEIPAEISAEIIE